MTAPRCPVCGGPMPAPARTGRPRTYCSTRCRKRHGHLAERDRRREQARAAMAMSHDELLDWLRSIPDPFAGPG